MVQRVITYVESRDYIGALYTEGVKDAALQRNTIWKCAHRHTTFEEAEQCAARELERRIGAA